MQMAMEGRATAGPNAATTERKKRRANAKAEMEKAKKLAEGMKEGAAYAAPPTSPDSQSSEEEREEGSYPEPNASADSEPSGSQQGTEDEDAEATQAAPRDPMQAADEGAEDEGAEEADEGAEEEQSSRGALARADELAATRLAADDHDQDSKDTKEEGDTGDEEHEAEEKDREGKGQAGPTLTTAESAGGGDACSFSPPPVDRTHHSVCLSPPRRERKLSGEDQQEDAKRSKSPEKEDVGQDGMDGFWERHREKMVQAAALQTQQNNQLMAMMKQFVEEGRNPVTGLPPPARR